MLPQAASDFASDTSRLTLDVLRKTRRAWTQMGPDFDTSWSRVGPQIVALVAAGQLDVARRASQYVPAVLEEMGTPAEAAGKVSARTIAGVAADGRPLDSLLYSAVTHAKSRIATGFPVPAALSAGGKHLTVLTQTTLADASRTATHVGIAARQQVGWVRMVATPCCSRCAILAGKWFRWNTGFLRHPGCRCRHIPAVEDVAGDLSTSPAELFRSGLVRGLSDGQTQALADGADPSQVVNAYRNGRFGRAAGMTTTEGTTKRGVAGQLLQGRQRLTPDAVYRIASTREEAVALLKRFGYLT